MFTEYVLAGIAITTVAASGIYVFKAFRKIEKENKVINRQEWKLLAAEYQKRFWWEQENIIAPSGFRRDEWIAIAARHLVYLTDQEGAAFPYEYAYARVIQQFHVEGLIYGDVDLKWDDAEACKFAYKLYTQY